MKPRKLLAKIKSPTALKRILSKSRNGTGDQSGRKSKAKSRGNPQVGKTRVVFTNGCFDLLHPGHVHYLENARAQGELLVVALNSDESVRTLKGPERPINTLADRLEVMAALECVDYVTWFEAETPLDLILLLQPDILVKGGDWKIDQIVGGREVVAGGGKVRSLKYIEGKSTTEIIRRSRSRLHS